ncbi:uncharacterized protein LOC131398061 [Diceros bicornis minor]|uniref:uncharacterized protein LOC131398061 n=1 Tax=Diceros bicornis minor TaxID=77932 RepID=UPI0026EEDA44|nr:uncharacterized protein LOC131398061 [Diceros bicornis minor]
MHPTHPTNQMELDPPLSKSSPAHVLCILVRSHRVPANQAQSPGVWLYSVFTASSTSNPSANPPKSILTEPFFWPLPEIPEPPASAPAPLSAITPTSLPLDAPRDCRDRSVLRPLLQGWDGPVLQPPPYSKEPMSHSPPLNTFCRALLALNHGTYFASLSTIHHPHPSSAPGEQGPVCITSTPNSTQKSGASSQTLHAGPQIVYFAELHSGRLSAPTWRDVIASLQTPRLINCQASRIYLTLCGGHHEENSLWSKRNPSLLLVTRPSTRPHGSGIPITWAARGSKQDLKPLLASGEHPRSRTKALGRPRGLAVKCARSAAGGLGFGSWAHTDAPLLRPC